MAKRKKNQVRLDEALQNFIDENRLRGGIDKVNAAKAWSELMGPGVNSYTDSVELRGKVLYVRLSSSVLREELSMGKSKIVEMLNTELGREVVEKVVLR